MRMFTNFHSFSLWLYFLFLNITQKALFVNYPEFRAYSTEIPVFITTLTKVRESCFLTFSHDYREGHYDTTKLLLERDAQVNVPSGSNDDTPLTLSCWKGI